MPTYQDRDGHYHFIDSVDHESLLPPGCAMVADGRFEQIDRANAKRAEIDIAYHAAITAVTDGYTQEERDSWSKQESEARAVLLDASAPTPLLSAIAAARGITVSELAAIVVEKADLYAALAGAAFGRRRALLDALATAQTPEALGAITW